MNNAELNQLLSSLGLTEYESKTLSTLFNLGEAEAPDISRLAQVPKTRVYDVLEKLVGKSLVIEIKSRPKKYRVMNSPEVLDSLIEERKKQLQELERQVKDVKSSLASAGKIKMDAKSESVIKVKDKHDFERILAQELEKAKNTIVGFTEISNKSHILHSALEKAKEKNVTIKLLNSFASDALKKIVTKKRLFLH